MNKEELIYTIKVIVILLIILIPMIIFMNKEDKKAIDYCLSQGYSRTTCERE